MEPKIYKKVLYLLNKTKSFSKLCKELNLSYEETLSLVNIVKENNDFFNIVGDRIVKKVRPKSFDNTYIIDCNKDKIKVMLISDTHLSSKYDDIDLLNKVYDIADKKHIDYIFHAGDLTDGMLDIDGYKSNLKESTYDGQVDYTVNYYPKYDGKTYIISGNHDDKWYKINGKEIISDISSKRDDIVYLGPVSAKVKLGTMDLQLVHGDTNPITSSQFGIGKYVDSLDYKPDIIEFGHKHKSLYTNINNIECFRCASLINNPDKTKFGNERSIYILEISQSDKRIIKSDRRSFGK